MKKKLGLLLLTTLMLLPGCGAKEDNKVHLIILAGQSGARGKALNTDLVDGYENSDIEIIQDGLMMPNLNKIPTLIKNPEIKELKAGYGDSSTEHGPELGIGQTLASRYKKSNGNRRAVIVKYSACGSTFVDHWYSESMLNDKDISPLLNKKQIRENPTTGNEVGPLTNNLYQIIDEVKYILEDEGYESVVDGCIFIHGEQDAKEEVNMNIYEKALEYFIGDLRNYVDDQDMPFVVTEAVTNSAKYSNKLRTIQKNITSKVNNTSFVGAKDLYSNTFESWHFDAKSNMILGNRAASELISYNDDRKLKEVIHPTVEVPLNYKVELPQKAKSIKIGVASRIHVGNETLIGDEITQIISLKAVKINFKEVKSESIFGFLSKDKYSLSIESDSILPCKIELLIAENFPPTNLVNYRTYLTISPNELKPGCVLKKEFQYTRMQKGKPVYFRLIAADRELAKQVVIIPETRQLK